MVDSTRVVQRIMYALLMHPDFAPALVALIDEAEAIVGDDPPAVARLVALRLRRDPLLLARLLRVSREEAGWIAAGARRADGVAPDPDTGERREHR